MTNKIKFKRGIKTNLPILSYGEPAFVSDEEELYIGTKTNNIKLTSKSEIEDINSQIHKIGVINIINYNHLVEEEVNGIYNWTTAFNQAFSDLSDGGILVIPTGEYRITRATLQNKKSITINCAGIIMPLDNTIPLIGTITMKNITNSVFNGLSFNGNKENVTNTNKFGSQSLLNLDNSNNCIFNNIVFKNTCESAFNSNGNLNNIIFNNINLYNIGEHGFYFGGTNVKNVKFNNLYVEDIGMSTVNQSRQCGVIKFRNKTNNDIMYDNIHINGFEFKSSLTNVTGYQLLVLGYDTKNIIIENGKIKGKRTCIFATNVSMDNIKINNVELDGKYLFYGYNKLNGYGEEAIEGKRRIVINNSSLTCECKNYLEISRISNSKIKLSGNWDDSMSLSEDNNDIIFENNDIDMNSYRFSLTKLSNNLTISKCNYSNMSKTSPLYEINNNNETTCIIKFEDITESQEHNIFFQTNTAYNLIFMNSTIKGILKSTVTLNSLTVFNCNLVTAKLDKYITSQIWNINNVYDLLGVRYDYGIKSATCLSYNTNVNLDLRYVIAKSLDKGNLLITNDKGVPFSYTLDGDIVRLSLVEQDRSSDTIFKVIYSL